jgi:predicted HNH restriction endonuclease
MSNVWIFQSNPKRYDVFTEEIDNPKVRKGNWTINQFRNQIKKGDIALLWISGKKTVRGIYAIVDIISDPRYEKNNPEVWVDYRYRSKFKQPLLDTEIQKIPGLSKLSIINNYRKTNYPVTKSEWDLLQKESKKRGLEDNPEKVTVDFNEKPAIDKELEIRSLHEGNEKIVVQTIKERDLKLRKMAIQYHGTICAVCGFSFVKKYGKLGEGYIEIHHLKPISEYNGKVKVNPKTDLIPLCSNCHRMIHKPSDMLSVKQLKNIIKS